MSPHKSPTIALLLGVLVPGAGQAYAGRSLRGVAWFAAVTLLTFTGWAMTGPVLLTTYRMQFAVGGTPVALPTAIPEVANLGETMLAMAWLGTVADVDVGSPPTAPLGYALTASGAMLNVFASADAQRVCRAAGAAAAGGVARSPILAALLAWLLPGAGHWYLGRRAKGALAGAALLVTLGLGVLLAHGTVLQRERDQYFWSGEILAGAPALILSLADARNRIQQDLPLWELGLLCTTLAGLLNVLLILDAFATAERDAHGTERAAGPAPSPAQP